MSASNSMQAVIEILHSFWSNQGCLIGHSHSEKVGAGTMNPATFLRVLGPEPWRVGYVEPSFRSDDGRYAENPNRMQMHTQYQVILKPDPGNPQELYLGSLAAIGLDLSRHDIRFVEDNWDSPALGAWGLGWEVWLDGQEITQFTYFQQAGGHVLDPVSVEITYGLERITMYLQNQKEVWDINVDGVHSYADLYRDHEVNHCRYNFDVAQIDRLHRLFDLYSDEAETCLEQQLIDPAYDWIIRQSHTFNLLDSRGAIGVTERAKYFTGMRRQARTVADLYTARRMQLEYPMLPPVQPSFATSSQASDEQSAAGLPTEPADLLFEIGVEEMPAASVPTGIDQLKVLLCQHLTQARLAHGAVAVSGTVRRLVAQVRDIAPFQSGQVTERRGPSLKVAFDLDGRPTKAAAGFAKSQGLAVSDLVSKDGYVYAVSEQKGQASGEVLPETLMSVMDGFRWGRTMRWDSSGKEFIRPVRWLLSMLGDTVLPFTWGALTSANQTRLPRWQELGDKEKPGASQMQTVTSQQDWQRTLTVAGVMLDRGQRHSEVLRQVHAKAEASGGWLQDEDDLASEVTDLVEAPQAILGEFPREFLSLPVPVLSTVMRKHQRYFPVCVAGKPAELEPRFIAVINSSNLRDPNLVRTGNEQVIKARFADAAFFIERDLATPLSKHADRLGSLVFHARMGSMSDKVRRLEGLVSDIGGLLQFSSEVLSHAQRAASLCKNDLVTDMVIEMTSLQGTMGQIYAKAEGEPEPVCAAIGEHYSPRQSGDRVPNSQPGIALALADRLDSLSALLAAGVTPRGSADPFGLRRLAIGFVHILLEHQLHLDLASAIDMAVARLATDTPDDNAENILTFINRRLRVVMQERGISANVADTVKASLWQDPVFQLQVGEALTRLAKDPVWTRELETYERCIRILPKDQDLVSEQRWLTPWSADRQGPEVTPPEPAPEPEESHPPTRP